eukprot:scaffold7700_cov132-Isochrysis_galbana.AAC.7
MAAMAIAEDGEAGDGWCSAWPKTACTLFSSTTSRAQPRARTAVLKRISAGSLAARKGKDCAATVQSRESNVGWLAIASAELRAAAMLPQIGAAVKVRRPKASIAAAPIA